MYILKTCRCISTQRECHHFLNGLNASDWNLNNITTGLCVEELLEQEGSYLAPVSFHFFLQLPTRPLSSSGSPVGRKLRLFILLQVKEEEKERERGKIKNQASTGKQAADRGTEKVP